MLILLVLLVLAAIFAIGWSFSNVILKPVPYGLFPEFDIIAVDGNSVTLPVPPNTNQFANTRREGRFGLLWEGGYGELGPVLTETASSVTRDLSNVIGEPPRPGAAAQMEGSLYRRNPKDDLGLEYEALDLSGEVTPLRAWWLPQNEKIAVLMLHGRRRGELHDTMRMMPALSKQGYSILSLSYRNHSDSADSPDGFYHYGQTEWRDVVTGLEFLQEQGVERVVLYGFSMGGALALETLKQYSALEASAPLPTVEALILDSPLLDPRTVFRLGARNAGLPLPHKVADTALFVARLRAGINWNAIDQRRYASKLSVPTLLIASINDQTTPIDMMDDFAAKAPTAEYHKIEAEHVDGWNVDSKQYEAWVEGFLTRNAPLD